MKPEGGQSRVVIEHISPVIDGGRYPAKRVQGDVVKVTAAIFGDGHDHLGAQVLYRHESQREWKSLPFSPLTNDLWEAEFPVDKLGNWVFTVEAWIDHFDTWVHDLEKRLAAQPDPHEPTQQVGPQDIPLAFRIGAKLIQDAASRANDSDAKALADAANKLTALAEANHKFYTTPITDSLVALAAKYPDLKHATRYSNELPLWVDRERARFSSWYELFPRSCAAEPGEHGTLRDVAARVPQIAGMGFDVLYMPPIHPIGVAYRKGKNNSVTAELGEVGSPWAIGGKEGGHTELHPQLGTLADFDALQAAAQENSIDLALDIAFQCSPDHPWVAAHPDWFIIRPDGSIQYAENPPKKYQDIYPLNFESPDWQGLWDALHGVFAFWIDRGVRVFRVDNPHTKALPFWEWCIAEIHKNTPEVIFLAEAFTRPHVMYSLAKGGYSQGYTYFTWRNTKADLQTYFDEICNPPVRDYFRPNVWPNTPDILHEQLQVVDPEDRRSVFLQRVILAATLSANYGIYGPAYELCEGRAAKPAAGRKGSEEYLDSEKYQLRSWNLDDPISIASTIKLLNEIRHTNPALQRNEGLYFHTAQNDQIMVYSKTTEDFSNTVLVVVNLDNTAEQSAWMQLRLDKLGVPWDTEFEVQDLLTGNTYTWKEWSYAALTPALPAHILHVIRPADAPAMTPQKSL